MSIRTILPHFLLSAGVGLSSMDLGAADVHGIHPVTDRILAVRIVDGTQDNHNPDTGDILDAVQYTSGLLDTAAADLPAKYTLGSADDPAFAAAPAAVAAGRKSKGIEYTGPATYHRDADSPNEWLREHWIYLALPARMTVGKTYTLAIAPGIVHNGNTWTFTFDPAALDSPTVHVGQGGFTPQAPKYAYISQWMGSFNTATHPAGGLELDADYTGAAFHVVNTDTGATAFSGVIQPQFDKTLDDDNADTRGPTRNYSNCDVWEADFSALTTPGRYRVVVERMGRSLPFEISANAYRAALRASLKGLFWQRSGIDKEIRTGLYMPRAHHPEMPAVTMYYDPSYKYWKNPDQNVPGFDFTTRPINPATGSIYGWYYDAGDWDAYMKSHMTVPLSLMMIYNMWPDKFRDGDAGNRYRLDPAGPWIDEGSNGVPDLIDEARWLVDVCRNSRDVLIAHGYGTGGVPGYYGRDAGASSGAWGDTRPVAVTAEDPEVTYQFAHALAYLAITLNTFHQLTHPGQNHPESATLIAEAVAALAWADNYLAANPADEVSGVLHDDGKDRLKTALKTNRMGAVAALYAATGNTSYSTQYMDLFNNWYREEWNGYWMTPSTGQIGELTYLMLPNGFPGLDTAFRDLWRTRKGNARSEVVDSMNSRGFRLPFARSRWLIMGEMSTPSPSGPISHYFRPTDSDIVKAMHAAAAYYLGGNQINRSHMTGIGYMRENSPFLPNEWALLDQTGMVYRYGNLPGITVYNANFNVSGLGSEQWARGSFSPASTFNVSDPLNNWPWGELRSNSRESIAGSEFTVWQLFPCNVWTYGALCSAGDAAAAVNEPPAVVLPIAEGAVLPAAAPTPLAVGGSSDLDQVEYYFNWQFIGRSDNPATGFRVFLDPARLGVVPGATAVITAIGRDRMGELSLQTADVDRAVSFATMTVVPVTGVSIANAPAAPVAVNRTHPLTAVVSPANATFRHVVWTTSNPAVATVDTAGFLTAHAPGTVTVTARTADGLFSASATVTTVYKALTSISIAGAPASLAVNTSTTAAASLNPSDTSEFDLLWSSSNPAAITVAQDGTISALAVGSATITVLERTSGRSASAAITAVFKPLLSLSISNAPSTLAQFQYLQLQAVRNPADTSQPELTWSSSNPAVITVDQHGRIFGWASSGSATITVTGAGGAVSATTAPISTYFQQPTGSVVLLQESAPAAANWRLFAHANLGPAGHNLNPQLTGGEALSLSTGSYTNTLGSNDHLFDNTYLLRSIPSVGLAVGERLVLGFTVTADEGPSNQIRALRGLRFSFIGSGGLTIPAASTYFGSANPGAVTGNDLDYVFSGTNNFRAINLGGAATMQGPQISNGLANPATNNVGSDKLYSSGSLTFAQTSATILPSSWTGKRVEFTMERIADVGGYAAFTITTRLFGEDDVTVAHTFTNTTIPNSTNNQGSGARVVFDAIAIGLGASGQVFNNGTGKLQFTIDDVRVDYDTGIQPTPFELWQASVNWGTADSSEGGDPERDGLPNLLEYAFNSNPLVPDAGLAGPAALHDTVAATHYLVLSHLRNTGATDLSFSYEKSFDLSGWSPYTPATADIASEQLDTTTMAVEVRTALPPAGPVFLRMKVSRP